MMTGENSDILYFQLSEEGLKKKVRGGEKIAGYTILVIGFLVAYSFYLSQIAFRWWHLIVGLVVLWLLIEAGAYLIRRHRLKRWSDYKLGYENDVIFELRNNEKTAEVFRNQVTSVADVLTGIEVSSFKDRLIAPYDLIDFDQLEVRLENWRPPGSSPEARRLKRIANLNQVLNEREEHTRMEEVRKVKSRREFWSIFKRNRY